MAWACHSSWSSMRSQSLAPIAPSFSNPSSPNVPGFHAPLNCIVALTGKHPNSER